MNAVSDKPSGKLMRVYFFAIPAIPGFLYLYVHLANKKK